MASDTSVPLNYFAVLNKVHSLIPNGKRIIKIKIDLMIQLIVYLDSIIVSEGANTMDIGRTILANSLPRHRLDAGMVLFYIVQNFKTNSLTFRLVWHHGCWASLRNRSSYVLPRPFSFKACDMR